MNDPTLSEEEAELLRHLALAPAHELADTLRDVFWHIMAHASDADLQVIGAGYEARTATGH